MARGINKVILIGNLGADPETRYSQAGNAVTRLRLATTDTWRDRQTGEQQERTEWHDVVCFQRLGEIAGEYLRKGSKVYIEGSLSTRSWDDQETGQKRYRTEVIARDMQMLDSRGGTGGDGGPPTGFEPRSRGGAADSRADNRPDNRPTLPEDDDFDDDIPF